MVGLDAPLASLELVIGGVWEFVLQPDREKIRANPRYIGRLRYLGRLKKFFEAIRFFLFQHEP